MNLAIRKDLKMEQMQQLRFEVEGWERSLEFIQFENVHLKTQLAAILKTNIDESFLENAEFFQGRFIELDHIIRTIKEDAQLHERLLQHEVYINGMPPDKIIREHKKLGRDIDEAEAKFKKLKSDFNHYLTEYYQP